VFVALAVDQIEGKGSAGQGKEAEAQYGVFKHWNSAWWWLWIDPGYRHEFSVR
jgi:hypothetical protein